MKLYREILIESAEQAEQLPLGTVATSPIVDAVAVRVGYGLGWSVSGDEMSDMHEHLIGWTALVPIEAEEVHSEDYDTHHLLEAWTSTHPITAYFPKETQ